ncbi:RNA polymerase sigma factor [Myxococcota bacterium]|nr:RNA polymerase sigma factor [Myxococcota bacterium]
MAASETHRVIEAVFRIESAKLIAHLARVVRDVGVAEELAQDALVAALEQWPTSGIPNSPGAWLMGVAKHRAIDRVRKRRLVERKHEALGRELDEADVPQLEELLDDHVGDELLRLVLVACHPVLAPDARVALTLRLVGGLSTAELARAFLVPEATMQQRIVRAKRALTEAAVPFEVPRGAELEARLESVLDVVYLVFNEGYAATSGGDWMRPALVEDALRLGRILTHLVPDHAEAHALVALMELQASRIAARTTRRGDPILLLDQDRALWNRMAIVRGFGALDRAAALGGVLGRYALEAAIAACHARARTADETDWRMIAALYGALVARVPSPVIELNRAVAVSMADGPAAGLELVDALLEESSLADYHLLPAVRADLLAKLGRIEEARAELTRAITRTKNDREKALLEARRDALA